MIPSATILVFVIAATLSSTCATKIPAGAEAVPSPQPRGTQPLSATGLDDVNGLFPEAVLVKTPTQTFCANYAFCVVGGRVYYQDLRKAQPKWKLMGASGLPRSLSPEFKVPRKIVEISADADSLLALSDEGRLYGCSLSDKDAARKFESVDAFGWPDKVPVGLNALVSGFRGWSTSVRRGDVLWYEDVFGNQHHYGTIGIQTIFFLTADGREIRYLDPGLPADFSHGLLGPERGRFAARSISASASTVFLIGDSGEMYTRLADFDTLGSDPMFFKYTYVKEPSNLPGSDFKSYFTPWALPSEDWKSQPRIPLAGSARISSRISIHQTGHGNGARELRVAGISANGDSGYWHKMINDGEWRFETCPLAIRDSILLPVRAGDHGETQLPQPREYSYSGWYWEKGERKGSLSFDVPDFPMIEGNCHLTISRGNERVAMTLYPVDLWTYFRRYDPGLDGTVKNFLVTVSYDEAALDGVSAEFADELRSLFGGLNLKVFSCMIEATSSWLQLEFGIDGLGERILFLTREGLPELYPLFVRQATFVDDPVSRRYFDAELAPGGDAAANAAALEANLRYKDLLLREIARYRAYDGVAGISRFGYSAFDFVAKITLLNKVNFPQIKTVTTYGGNIMDINANGYSVEAEMRKWAYTAILDLVDARLYYLRSPSTGAPRALSTWPEYLRHAGITGDIDGLIQGAQVVPARVSTLDDYPLFPVFSLEGDGTHALVELKDAARALGYFDPTSGVPLLLAGTYYQAVQGDAVGRPRGIPCEVEWDGKTLRVWGVSAPFPRKLLYRGDKVN